MHQVSLIINAEKRLRLLRELTPEPFTLDGEQKQDFYKLMEFYHEALVWDHKRGGDRFSEDGNPYW